MLGGGLGNLLTVALRREFVLSLGFSTAVFAAIGALAGYMVLHHESKRYLPLAAGVGILAMWGMGEGNVDYLAHICGLVAGMALGFWEALRTRRRRPGLPQWLSALLAPFCPCWPGCRLFNRDDGETVSSGTVRHHGWRPKKLRPHGNAAGRSFFMARC